MTLGKHEQSKTDGHNIYSGPFFLTGLLAIIFVFPTVSMAGQLPVALLALKKESKQPRTMGRSDCKVTVESDFDIMHKLSVT